MNSPPTPPDVEAPGGDPWAAFGYLVAGVAFYGAIGWALSVWLDATYWIPIGILVGAAFGMYMVFARYRVRPPQGGPSKSGLPKTGLPKADRQIPNTPIDADAGSQEPPLRNDRGDRA
jgi:hypothetical protein